MRTTFEFEDLSQQWEDGRSWKEKKNSSALFILLIASWLLKSENGEKNLALSMECFSSTSTNSMNTPSRNSQSNVNSHIEIMSPYIYILKFLWPNKINKAWNKKKRSKLTFKNYPFSMSPNKAHIFWADDLV